MQSLRGSSLKSGM